MIDERERAWKQRQVMIDRNELPNLPATGHVNTDDASIWAIHQQERASKRVNLPATGRINTDDASTQVTY